MIPRRRADPFDPLAEPYRHARKLYSQFIDQVCEKDRVGLWPVGTKRDERLASLDQVLGELDRKLAKVEAEIEALDGGIQA